MEKHLTRAAVLLATGLLVACNPGKKDQKNAAEETWTRTEETEKLLTNLKGTSAQGVMFGHHDDTVYGIGWEGEEGRSDVKSVCGDYPCAHAVFCVSIRHDGFRGNDCGVFLLAFIPAQLL